MKKNFTISSLLKFKHGSILGLTEEGKSAEGPLLGGEQQQAQLQEIGLWDLAKDLVLNCLEKFQKHGRLFKIGTKDEYINS